MIGLVNGASAYVCGKPRVLRSCVDLHKTRNLVGRCDICTCSTTWSEADRVRLTRVLTAPAKFKRYTEHATRSAPSAPHEFDVCEDTGAGIPTRRVAGHFVGVYLPTENRDGLLTHSHLRNRWICSPHPKFALCYTLCFPRSAVVWVARGRQVIVTRWCRPAQFLASRHSELPPFAGMIDSLLESARFEGDLGQVRVELGKPHRTDKSRNKALDEHELFSSGEIVDAMHELPNHRVIQPFVEGTLPCIDAVLLRNFVHEPSRC